MPKLNEILKWFTVDKLKKSFFFSFTHRADSISIAYNTKFAIEKEL